jgi:competence protein ComEA
MSDLRGPGSSLTHPLIDEPLDLNAASEEELAAIPGVGAARARRIVEWRHTHGPYEAVDDLQHVPEVGQRGLQEFREFVTVLPLDQR